MGGNGSICDAPDERLDCEGCGAYPGDKHTVECPVYAEQIRPKSVLEEAARIVAGPRQAAYGHPRDNHACTAELWNAYIFRRFQAQAEESRGLVAMEELHTLDAVDVCVLNVLQKLSRFANTRQRDSIVDAAGFLANIEMILNGKWDGST